MQHLVRLWAILFAGWLALAPLAPVWAASDAASHAPAQASPSMIFIPTAMAPPASEPVGDWPPDSSSVQIEWDDSTTVVGEAHLGLLRAADPETHEYVFDQAGAAAAGLDLSPGRNLFIYNTAVRRIISATPDGADIVLETEFVELTEAIENAEIDWDLGIEFDPALIAEVSVMGETLTPDADGKVTFEFKQGDFTYNLELVLQGDKSTVDFKVTKTVAGALSTSLTAVGTVERFRVKNNITIQNNELTNFSHGQDKMRGALTLGLITQASGSDRVNIELPIVLLKIPTVVAGIPVVVNVKVQFVFFAEVPVSGSAQVSTRFTYDSDMGLQYDGVQVQANARVGNLTFDPITNQTGAAGAISANFGMGYPRVELGIFGETIVPWAQTAFNVGGSYTMFPACQTADALMLGAAGLNLSFLGVKVNLGSTTFFRQERKLLRAGDCPD
jgi:hypothetical protein